MRILVGMSGGLDSSYAAMKLIDAGHSVEGAYLVMHEYAERNSAAEAAQKLGIPLHVIDCRDAFDRIVRENFVSEYKRGRTPNPCLICNPGVKFSSLLGYALKNGFDLIATGHYARVTEQSRGDEVYYSVATAHDTAKDQSYMLYRLSQQILGKLVLPLGDERKSDIRERIKDSRFASFDKKDSQEICFIPDGDYAGYIEARAGKSLPGDFVAEDGRVLGEHKGIIRYTLGQRKGLGISAGERMFITDIDHTSNTIRVGTSPKSSAFALLEDLILSKAVEDAEVFRCKVKIRYAASPVPAEVRITADGGAIVRFDDPQRSVTPGQSAVFYDGDRIIGGGVICK